MKSSQLHVSCLVYTVIVEVSSSDILSRNEGNVMMQDQSQGKNMVRFYLGLGPLESNNPTSSLSLLIYGFLLLIPIPSMEFGLLFL
jgi:hypothetical protein